MINLRCHKEGEPLKIVGDRLHDGHDFFVSSSAKGSVFDYLIFLDSRGIGRQFKGLLGHRLITRISQLDKTYIIVCRPLDLTIWASLIGFLANNKFEVAKIITNMGFVDFTPKKYSILQDVTKQVASNVKKGVTKTYFVEDYVSETETIPLYAIRYGDAYQCAVQDIADNYNMLIINTPLTDPRIRVDRKRPASFFAAQEHSNAFNKSIAGVQLIDLPNFDESFTYDAVHYTDVGNELIFNRVEEYL